MKLIKFIPLISTAAYANECSCNIQAMQNSVATVSNDLSSRGFDVGPINDMMNAMDEAMPMIMAELKSQGIEEPDEFMAELGLSPTDIATMIEETYTEFSEILEIKEVKNLWNTGMKAGKNSFDIVDTAIEKGVDAMQPEFDQIFSSMGWLEKSNSRKKRDTTDTKVSAEDVENMVRNLHKVLTKLFNEYLTGDLIQGYAEDVMSQVVPIGGKIDDLISSPDFSKILGEMFSGEEESRKKRATEIEEYEKYAELFYEQASLFVGNLKDTNDTLTPLTDYAMNMTDWEGVFMPLIEGLGPKVEFLEPLISEIMKDFENFGTANFVSGLMTNIETIVSSDGVNELITYALSIPKKFTEEVTEDEMVQLAKYAMAIMVQGMDAMESMKENNGNSTLSSDDILGNFGISKEDLDFNLSDLFDMFGGDDENSDRKRRAASVRRARRDTCTCSGYNGSYFLKNRQSVVGACVGVAGLVKFL